MTESVADLGYVHRWVPGRPGGEGTTLLLLHGTGGNEHDMLSLGATLDDGAALLSPRGNVLENGMQRFFRRLSEGVFDIPDLIARTHELAAFIEAAANQYGFDRTRLIAVGFSNGANIAASMLLLRPELLRNAVLFSPMVPFIPDTPPALSGTRAFIGAGRRDSIAPPRSTEELARLLERSGAEVTLHWHEDGHMLTPYEVTAAKEWIRVLEETR